MIKAASACIATFIAGLSLAAVALGQGNPPVNALSVAPSSTATSVQVVTRTLSAPTTVYAAPKTRVEQVAVAVNSPPITETVTVTTTAIATTTATKTETAEPEPTMVAFKKKGKPSE